MKNFFTLALIALSFGLLAFVAKSDKNEFSEVEINQSTDQVLRLYKSDNPEQSLISMSSEGIMHLGPNLKRSQSPKDGYYLYVEKGIRTERVKVDVAADNGWADYVFEDGYPLLSLEDLENYIAKHGHLPGVSSTEQVKQEGLDLAVANKQLLEKVEELSLYVLQLNQRIKDLEQE